MANPGIGNKFVSVNLNKSYGQPLQHPPPPTNSYHASRSRVGGGYVVLSKPRNVQKAGTKLSVPPPLNLPSLRKEHEHFDFTGNTHPGGGTATGLRASSSVIGWTKPTVIAEKESSGGARSIGSLDFDGSIGTTYKGSAYMPPSFHNEIVSHPSRGSMLSNTPLSERNLGFRGEDFPSLGAKISESSYLQKQKLDPHRKQKQPPNQEITKERGNNVLAVSSGDLNCGPPGNIYGVKENSGETAPMIISTALAKTRKNDDFVQGLLPLVNLNSRSDWADDERDTGNGARDRSTVQTHQKGEQYRDTALKDTVFPYKKQIDVFNSRDHRDDENLKYFSAEMMKLDSHGQDIRGMSRDGHDGWRASRFHKEGYGSQDTVNGTTKGLQFSNSFVEPGYDNTRRWTSAYGRKDTGYVQGGRQWRHTADSQGSWSTDKSKKYYVDQSSRHRGDIMRPKSPFSSRTRGDPFSNDPVLSFGKLKHPFQKRDDGGVSDDHDIFSNSIGVGGLLKKKKEALKTDYYDPVRESFEAELERIQILQEQERQRIIEEQEMAVEIARREEEDRIRLAKEHEEMQRRLEEEAREAAVRAEQERLEALRRAEEQRLAREEEKQKIFMEEERRKQAAKQKLLELEARIAKRQFEEAKSNNTQQNVLHTSNAAGIASEKGSDWEESEKMAERVTTSASSDTSGMSMFVDTGLRPTSYVEPPLSFTERGKSVNVWRRDPLERGINLSSAKDSAHSGIKGDTPLEDNIFWRKEHNNARAVSSRNYREDTFRYNVDGFSHVNQQRWNISGDADSFIKDMENDSEFHRDSADKFRESVWGRQNQGFGNPHSSHSGRVYQNSDADVFHSVGRSRYSIRQPRVLPPPSAPPMHKSRQITEEDFPGPSASLRLNVRGRSSSTNPDYKFNSWEGIEVDAVVGHHCKSPVDDYKIIKNPSAGCDSQSTLSVSSAPNSPTHLSHDDMEDSISSMLTVAAEGKNVMLEKNTSPDDEVGKISDVRFSCGDDEWVEKNVGLQEPEEYDGDDSCYEEEEVHEVDNTGMDMVHGFEDFHLQEKQSEEGMDHKLGFSMSDEAGTNEGREKRMENEENEFCSARVSSDTMAIPETHIGVLGHFLSVNDSFQSATQNTEKVTSGDLDLGLTEGASQPMDLGQAGLPVNHHFGTSQIPAIQIGSIRMPLHLHQQENQPLAHLQPPQPLQFQFGQLRCTIPVSQGLIPLNSRTVSYAKKPVVTGRHSVTQSVEGTIPLHPTTFRTDFGNFSPPRSINCSKAFMPGCTDRTKDDCSFNARETQKNAVLLPQGRSTSSSMDRETMRSESRSVLDDTVVSPSGTKIMKNHPYTRAPSRGTVMKHENIKTIGRERRFFNNRNGSTLEPMFSPGDSRFDSTGYQRRQRRIFPRPEFCVRENIDRNQTMNLNVEDEKSHLNGRVIRVSASNVQQKGPLLNEITRRTGKPEWLGTGPRSSPYLDPVGNSDKKSIKESVRKKNYYGTVNGIAEDADFATLRSGVVCDSEQPGLMHSDGDDFIEVRSKKQVLNDRRKQKAKEAKSRSRVTKSKPQRIFPNEVFPLSTSKVSSADAGLGNNIFSGFASNEDHALINEEESNGFNTSPVSQALAPIGTPPLNTNIKDVINLDVRRYSSQVNSFDGNAPEILPLTQSQFDEAMKPAHYETHTVSLGGQSSPVSELNMLPSTMKDKSFGSASTTLDSLLAGEKVQFGVVTAPQIISSNNLVISHGVGSTSSEIPFHSRGSLTKAECSLLQNSHACLNDCGVDAEAAASAVAAAAISCDEVGPRDLRSQITSLSDGRCYGVVGISGISSTDDTVGGQQLSDKSMPEVSMSVSLPADLSVDTPPISLWPPPLASPHNSSGQMLPHLPGESPPHFQFFDMNPMAGNPVFSFGPHENVSRCQSQPQSSASCSGSLGQWQQQHHNGVDSVYGSSTSFTGSFINPHGGIPNVHGPPHMFVYNHFSPIGQFGQMGLSFMGTTYVPSGKQPDWQHNPTTSGLGSSGGSDNGGMGSVNVFPAQHNSSNAPPVQHLAPGSPLLAVDSLPMFDTHSFQASVDMGSWSRHLPTSVIPSLVPQAASPLSSRPSPPSLPEPCSFPLMAAAPAGADSGVNHFPDELGPSKDGRSTGGRTGDGTRQSMKQQYGYGYPRGVHHGRTGVGFQGRNTAKVVRQIYVPKQTSADD